MDKSVERRKNIAILSMKRILRDLETIHSTAPLYGAAHKQLKQSMVCLSKAIEAERRCRPRFVESPAPSEPQPNPIFSSPNVEEQAEAVETERTSEEPSIKVFKSRESLGRGFRPGDVGEVLDLIESLGGKAPWVITRNDYVYEIKPLKMKSVVKAVDDFSIPLGHIKAIGVLNE